MLPPDDLPDNVIRLCDRRVRLCPTGPEPDQELLAERVDEDGLVLRDAGELSLGRYVWFDLELPDDEPVRVLGEVLPRRDPTSLALDIKFKHLFPDHKRRLLTALAGRGWR